MAAQKKTSEDIQFYTGTPSEAAADSARPVASDEDHAAAPSPARALQAGLQAEFSRTDFPFSQMQVISAIVVFCFAVWWALFQVVAVLV
jgi:hypothetical protein